MRVGVNLVLALIGLDLDGALPVQVKQILDCTTDRSVLDGVDDDAAADHLHWRGLNFVLYLNFVNFVLVDFVLDLVNFVLMDFVLDLVDFFVLVNFFVLDFVLVTLDLVNLMDFVFVLFGFQDVFDFTFAPHFQMAAGIVQTLALDFVAVTVFVLLGI